MLLSNILVLSQPKMASVEGRSVCSYRNPSFKPRAGTDGFLPGQAIRHHSWHRQRTEQDMRHSWSMRLIQLVKIVLSTAWPIVAPKMPS